MKVSVRIILVIALLIGSTTVWADIINLSARPREFNAKTLGPSGSHGRISGSLRILEFKGGKGWPAAAYIGFHQGLNRNESIQFLLIRIRETDTYLVAGYRLIEAGKEAKVEALANLPLHSSVRVSLSFESGLVTLQMNDKAPVRVRTSLSEVSPYVSVSSGTAEFNIDP
jgi:hypothetical protein